MRARRTKMIFKKRKLKRLLRKAKREDKEFQLNVLVSGIKREILFHL
jgi:hypothetical protein